MKSEKPLKHKIARGFVLGTMSVLLLMATGCKKKESTTTIDDTIISPIITPSTQPTAVPTPIAITPAPGVTITPIVTSTVEPTPTPAVFITQKQAEEKLKEKIDTTKYSYVLSDDNLNVDGKVYYIYVIYENDVELQPAVIVNAEDGSLSLYDSDGNVTVFTKFPVDKTESLESNEHEITQASALEALKKVTKEKLGLANNLSRYTIVADEWTTIIDGDVCYCFNVYEGNEEGQLAGRFYVSTTGKTFYKQDEFGDFIKIN